MGDPFLSSQASGRMHMKSAQVDESIIFEGHCLRSLRVSRMFAAVGNAMLRVEFHELSTANMTFSR